jgi:serine/threonine protein kinase
MWSSRQISFEDIGIQGLYTIPTIPTIDQTNVSKYDTTTKELLSSDGKRKIPLVIESQLDHGSYGNLYLGKRGNKYVLLKQPRMSEMNLLQEGVLQHLASKTLESLHMGWAIPKVYDVFQKGPHEIWFSMERIYGMSVEEWFFHTQTPEKDFFLLLAQVCLILGALETHLNLDHRDLKSNNLLLLKEPCVIHVLLNQRLWTLQSPFTVVVLDFGFACLGSEALRGKPWVNLGDGVLPPMDPCPKEGRDIFHLLISLSGLPIMNQRLSNRVREQIDRWLSFGNKSYGPLARRWSTQHWSYLVSSQPDFAISSCCPLQILDNISSELHGHLSHT